MIKSLEESRNFMGDLFGVFLQLLPNCAQKTPEFMVFRVETATFALKIV
jgi:hypothetical protein